MKAYTKAQMSDALRLAAEAGCAVKTANRALTEGVDGIRGALLRERLVKGALKLALTLPSASPAS